MTQAGNGAIRIADLMSSATGADFDLKGVAGAFEKISAVTVAEAFRKPEIVRSALPKDAGERRAVLGLIKLAHVAGDANVAVRALQVAGSSLAEIGRLPRGNLAKRLGTLDEKSAKAVRRLERNARAVYRAVAETATSRQTYQATMGTWLLDDPSKPKLPKVCFDCSCCDGIFGPRAYLFDLLDLIYYRWPMPTGRLEEPRRFTSDRLEAILLQEIDTLECDRGEQVVPQCRIACEVLELFLKPKLPLDDATWSAAWRQTWADLLAPGGSNASAFLAAADAAAATMTNLVAPATALQAALENTRPDLGVIDAGVDAARGLSEAGGPSPVSDAGFQLRLDAAVPRLLATYRDRLVAASDTNATTLGSNLFIDLRAGACQSTTRFSQLIVSLQSFILALRTGDIAGLHRPDLRAGVIDVNSLDPHAVEEEEWRWLGSFATWKAAIYTLVFPENVLPPPVTEEPLAALADEWSLGVTPAGVRDGFISVYFGPLDPIVRALPGSQQQPASTRALARRVLDTAKFATNYGSLDAWTAQVDVLARRPAVRDAAQDDVMPRARNNRVVWLEFPLLAAWALNRAGHFASAHDWLRRLYDPVRPRAQRAVFNFDSVLDLGRGDDPNLVRGDGELWLDDPLDPRLIARRRRGVYLRHVVLTMVRNLLDWADHEFAQEDVESVDRARQLYELAERALDVPALNRCEDAIHDIELEIISRAEPLVKPQRQSIRRSLRRLRAIRHRQVLDDTLATIGELARRPNRRLAQNIESAVDRALELDAKERPRDKVGVALARRRGAIAGDEDAYLFGFQPDPDPGNPPGGPVPDPLPGGPQGGGPRQPVDPVDWLKDHPIDEPDLPGEGDTVTDEQTGWREVPTVFTACVPENPLLSALRQQIDVNLAKMRACLSIVGEPLALKLVSCDPAAGAAAPRPDPVTDQAPRYRYSFLIEKARQYLEVAQRLEGALVQALEKREQARFDVLKARQATDLASATVDLRALQVTEAEQGRTVAELQEDRANTQSTFWDHRLGDATTADATLSAKEQDGLFWTDVSWRLQAGAAAANAAMVLPQIAMAAAGGTATMLGGLAGLVTAETGIGAVAGGATAGAGFVAMSLSLAAGLPGIAGALSAGGQAASTYANLQQTKAGYERRFDEWTLQRDLARADVAIAGAVVAQAGTRVDIADKEEDIARLQLTQAREILEFLQNRFDDVQLFEWMIDVLMRNYRMAMQLSTCVARLAQRALEFERQERIQIVLADYWTVTNTSLLAANLSDEQRSAGLLGAERLSTDLTKLDAFKLQTETRRLQMTKTISLAQVLPIEFQELRRTGHVTFNTLLDWFDRDFPGHYLRLIRSIKVSVLALIPPLDGVHAMLHNGGESSVVVAEIDAITGDRQFVKRRSMRNFGESIALDAAFASSGLFELRADDPLLLPFESLGVETQWTVELPPAFNRFNFGTIADVLLQIEYTALFDALHRTQVIAALPARDTFDASFDLGFAFPDGWYLLKNPRAADPPADRTLAFELPRAFFPPQFAAPPTVGHAALLVVGDFTGLHSDPTEAARLRGILRDGLALEKDGVVIAPAAVAASGEIAFGFAEVTERTLFETTRAAASALTPSPFSGLVAPGAWTLRARRPLYAEVDGDGEPLIRRIVDALFVLTVEGPVAWE